MDQPVAMFRGEHIFHWPISTVDHRKQIPIFRGKLADWYKRFLPISLVYLRMTRKESSLRLLSRICFCINYVMEHGRYTTFLCERRIHQNCVIKLTNCLKERHLWCSFVQYNINKSVSIVKLEPASASNMTDRFFSR